VGGTIYNSHTLKPFKELGLDSQRAKKLASKLHVHSVNFAAKLVHTRRALSISVINSHQEGVTRGYKDGLQPETLADGNWLVKQNQPVSKIEIKSDTNLRSLYES